MAFGGSSSLSLSNYTIIIFLKCKRVNIVFVFCVWFPGFFSLFLLSLNFDLLQSFVSRRGEFIYAAWNESEDKRLREKSLSNEKKSLCICWVVFRQFHNLSITFELETKAKRRQKKSSRVENFFARSLSSSAVEFSYFIAGSSCRFSLKITRNASSRSRML